MSEHNNSKAVAVGAFIFLGLVILVIGILTIGGQRKAFVKTLSAKVIFSDVSGLQSGGNIWLSGVKIGTVQSVQFIGLSQVEVTLNIEKASRAYVRKDEKARISTDGLIGNKIIVLYGGSASSGEIEDGDTLQAERGVTTEDMANTLQANNKNLLEITGNFKTISKQLTGEEGTIGALINDASLAGKMRATITHLNIVSLQSEQVITNLVNYTNGLHKQGAFANQLISDTTIFSEIHQTVEQLKQASASASAFTEKLKTAGDGLNQTKTPAGMLLHDPAVATDMRTTIRNLQTSSVKLDEDLEALQHNFLLRGFFRRKAKEKAKADSRLQKDSLASPGGDADSAR